jgi:hypothetical protein
MTTIYLVIEFIPYQGYEIDSTTKAFSTESAAREYMASAQAVCKLECHPIEFHTDAK